MRLISFQAETIKELSKKYFEEQTTVCLFGSRTDDNKKGGGHRSFYSKQNYKIKEYITIRYGINIL
jgi:hypothetical protein